MPSEVPGRWRGRRGEWYVAIQGVLFALVFFGPAAPAGWSRWPAVMAPFATAGGMTLLLAGLPVCLVAAFHLGSNLTPLPHPRDDARLVVSGLYRFVRHPIYFGVLLMTFGWALYVQGWLTLGYAGLLLIFFDLKARREEAWLLQRFPEYAPYRKRVRKLIPFIY